MPPPCLENGPVRLREPEIVALDRPAVELDPTLVDHPPPVARRLPQPPCEEGREMDRVFRHLHLLDFVGRLVLAHDASEVLFAAACAVLAVPPAGDAACELELPLHGVVRMRVVA